MKKITEIIGGVTESLRLVEDLQGDKTALDVRGDSPPRPSESQQNSPKRHSEHEIFQITGVISQVCDIQKTYGKIPGDLKTLVKGFLWILSDYPMPEIIRGIREYVLENSDIPAPADIKRIIDPPPPKPEKLNAAVYVSIQKKKKNYEYITPTEEAFLREFERQEMQKVPKITSEKLRKKNIQLC